MTVWYSQRLPSNVCRFHLSVSISSPLPGLSICHTPVRQGPISARLKMSFHGGQNEVCVWEKRSAAGNVHKSCFFFLFFSLSLCATCLRQLLFPSLLSASLQDLSICIRPLKKFSDSCLQLFSHLGYDCNQPHASEIAPKSIHHCRLSC